jgi:large subunit ribosomal protein L18
MVSRVKETRLRRERRHRRVRHRISGTPQRPRLNVFRSSAHIYAQLIDDVAGRTLAAASTLEEAIKEKNIRPKVAQAEAVGRLIGERAKAIGIKQVVFDRGGYLYHGRVKAVAEGARAAGLEF